MPPDPKKPKLKKLENTGKKDPSPSVKSAPRKKPLYDQKKPGKWEKTSPPAPVSPIVETEENPVVKTKVQRRTTSPGNPDPDDVPFDMIEEMTNKPLYKYLYESGEYHDVPPTSILSSKLVNLSAETYNRLRMLINLGAYFDDACEACGIPASMFHSWMKRGAEHVYRKRPSVYAKFYLDMTKAKAFVRTLTAAEVRFRNPEFWLRNGPGQTEQDRPGFSDKVRVTQDGSVNHVHSGRVELEPHATLIISRTDPNGAELVAQAFSHLAELGLIQTTEQGRKLVDGSIPVESKSVPSKNGHSSNGNGHTDNGTNRSNGKH